MSAGKVGRRIVVASTDPGVTERLERWERAGQRWRQERFTDEELRQVAARIADDEQRALAQRRSRVAWGRMAGRCYDCGRDRVFCVCVERFK